MVATSAVTGSLRIRRTSFVFSFPCKEPWLETGLGRRVSSATPTSSLIADISRVLEQLKDEAVLVRDAQELQEYLLRFPGIVDVLVDAVRAVKDHFPEGKLVLGMYRDPEMEDRYPFLCVRLKEYDEGFIERLEAAEAAFIDRLTEVEGWLQLTTDFKDPEMENAF